MEERGDELKAVTSNREGRRLFTSAPFETCQRAIGGGFHDVIPRCTREVAESRLKEVQRSSDCSTTHFKLGRALADSRSDQRRVYHSSNGEDVRARLRNVKRPRFLLKRGTRIVLTAVRLQLACVGVRTAGASGHSEGRSRLDTCFAAANVLVGSKRPGGHGEIHTPRAHGQSTHGGHEWLEPA